MPNVEYSWPIAAGANDGYVDGLGIHSTDASYQIGTVSAGPDSWLRFTGVTINQGQTVTAARIDVVSAGVAGSLGTAMRTKLKAEDIDDATINPVSQADYNARDRTTAAIDWDPTVWTAGTLYSSPDIKTIIQEIVDRAGWVNGNAIQLFWEDDGTAASIRIEGAAYEHETYDPAVLYVTLTEVALPTVAFDPDPPVAANGPTLAVPWAYTHATTVQTKYRLIWRRNSDAVVMYDSGWVTSAAETANIDLTLLDVAGVGETAAEMIISVQLGGVAAPPLSTINGVLCHASDLADFTPTLGAPHVTITAPTAADHTTPYVTATWSFADDRVGKIQAKYRVRLIRTGDSFVLHDSGWITGTGTSYPIPASLSHGTEYSVEIQLQNDEGIVSN